MSVSPPPPPSHAVAVADDPWRYDTGGRQGCIVQKYGGEIYGTMTPAELGATPIPSSRVLFMWATMPMWPVCLAVMRSRGFVFKGIHLVWLKKHTNGNDFNGMGGLTTSNVELLLLGVRPGAEGDEEIKPAEKCVIEIALKGHSIKPQVGYDEVLRFCEFHGLGRPIELFARCTERPGFDFGMGDQIELYKGMSPAEVARVSGIKRRVEKKKRKAAALAAAALLPPLRAGQKRRRRVLAEGESKPPKRPRAEVARERLVQKEIKIQAARGFGVSRGHGSLPVVLNPSEEYAVVIVRGVPSGSDIMRLDISRGLHQNGLLIVEADASSLNEIIHAVDALPGFRFVTLVFFAYESSDPTRMLFYVAAVQMGARVQFFRRRAHKQTIDLTPEEWEDDAQKFERVVTAISSMTGGARAAVLEICGESERASHDGYILTELGGSLEATRDPESIGLVHKAEIARKIKKEEKLRLARMRLSAAATGTEAEAEDENENDESSSTSENEEIFSSDEN